ncbi:MAG: 4'-phosphopantetheinyl transferase superfamily protein [Methyloceanibacter sp.]
MTWDASAGVNDLFAASARDCTPAPARHMASVLFAPVSRDPETVSRCASVLSDAEKRRAQSFLAEGREAHFKQQRAFRRYCGALAVGSALPLSRIAFEATEKGRPYLPELRGCWFSFSSCRLGYLGAWSSTRRIGVDIEDQTRHLEATELAQAYFSRAEAKAVEGAGERTRMQTFFQLWTLKEAALKSIGEGLPFGLDAFQFELDPSIRIVDAPRAYGGPERFCAYAIETAGSCAALAIRSDG